MAKATIHLFKGRPLRQLTRGATKTGGRNNQGRITSFHRGGGAKQSIRDIDMKRSTPDLTGTVERIEYDPFRTGRTALIRWDGDRASGKCRSGGDGEEGEASAASKAHRIKDMQRRALPSGIHDLPRRMLRSAVATICGVPVAQRKGREPLTVMIDGRKKFSSLAWEGGGWGAEALFFGVYPDLAEDNRYTARKMALDDIIVEIDKEKDIKMEKKTKMTVEVGKGIAALLKGV